MSNPLDEFLDEYGEKTALDWKGIGQHTGNALLGAMGVAAGTALVGSGALAVQHIYNAATAKRDFRNMMEWNQDLHHEDQRLVNQSFRTLRRFAPDMSKDPLIAGAMVRQMVQAPQGAAGIMQQALQGQKNIGSPIIDAYMSAAEKGMAEGMKGFTPLGAGLRQDEELKELKKRHDEELKKRHEEEIRKRREEEIRRRHEEEIRKLHEEELRKLRVAYKRRVADAFAKEREGGKKVTKAQAWTQLPLPGFEEARAATQLPLPGFTSEGGRILRVRRHTP